MASHDGQDMSAAGKARVRYRFGNFMLSPARRVLLRSGNEVPLIPRYFELLLMLVERRQEAVHRSEIFESVWSDVVVSDGALSQAIRTLRRTLGDDSRNPAYIRTVSRHGYRFIFREVCVEPDEPERVNAPFSPESASVPAESIQAPPESLRVSPEIIDDLAEKALRRLLRPGEDASEEEEHERREAAETLHSIGTAEALRLLNGQPGHERARALLRDTRWEAPGAGPVPLLGHPGGFGSFRALVAIRLKRASRLAGSRWAAASCGGAASGVCAGLPGGFVLRLCPGSDLPATSLVALSLVAAVIGGLGAAGVGAGLAVAEALARSSRSTALVALGALGGGAIGATAHLLGRWTLEGLFGHDLSPVGGGFEGLLIGGAAGLGYALSTPRPAGGGMASPRGWARLSTAAVTGLCCSAACVVLSLTGSKLGGVSLDYMARSFQGSHVGLAPLARLFGERDLGPLTRSVLGAYEGLFFGFGLAFGLTRRPR